MVALGVAVLALLAAGSARPANARRPVLWRLNLSKARLAADPAKGWFTQAPYAMALSRTPRGAKFQDASGLPWFYSRIARQVAIDPQHPFLEIEVLQRQAPRAVIQVRNSSYKGKSFGVLWRPGVYTYPVYEFQKGWEAKKEIILSLHGLDSSPGLPPQPGPWLELGHISLTRRPRNWLEMRWDDSEPPGKGGAGALSPGDKLALTAHLSSPAKDVYVEIIRPIYNNLVKLVDAPYIQLYPSDKTGRRWSAEIEVSAAAEPKRTFQPASLDITAVVVSGPVPAVGTSNPWELDLR